MSKHTRAMPRFKINDRVEISSEMHSKVSGRFGRVVEIRTSQHAQNLDKYLVLLDDSDEEHLVWDIELKPRQL